MKPTISHVTSKNDRFWMCEDDESIACGVGDDPLEAYNDYQSELKELGSEAYP